MTKTKFTPDQKIQIVMESIKSTILPTSVGAVHMLQYSELRPMQLPGSS